MKSDTVDVLVSIDTTPLMEASWAHLLRTLDDGGAIKLKRHEREYAVAAEDFLTGHDLDRCLPKQQASVIASLFVTYVKTQWR